MSRTSPPPGWLPLAAVATTLVLWASAFVAIRHLGHDFSPGALSLGRLLVGALCLGVFWAALWALRGVTREDRAMIAMLVHPGQWAAFLRSEARGP